MKDLKITIFNAEFNCRVLGNGTKNVVAFHGFAQDGDAFLPLAHNRPKFRIYSFDLPFHGDTDVLDPSISLTHELVGELIDKLIDRIAINRFSVLGFSIGARLALSILKRFHSRIECVWLMDPDGIKTNFWYGMMTGSSIKRHIFRKLLDRPGLIKQMVHSLFWLRLIDRRTLSFALGTLDTKEKRRKIFNTWIYLRKLKVKPISAFEKLAETRVPVYFILAGKDKIIPKTAVMSLSTRMSNISIRILPCWHQKLIECFADKPLMRSGQ